MPVFEVPVGIVVGRMDPAQPWMSGVFTILRATKVDSYVVTLGIVRSEYISFFSS